MLFDTLYFDFYRKFAVDAGFGRYIESCYLRIARSDVESEVAAVDADFLTVGSRERFILVEKFVESIFFEDSYIFEKFSCIFEVEACRMERGE